MLYNKLNRLNHSQQGSVAMIFAITVAVLIGVALLSVESSKQLNIESKFNNAVDQALLSVAAKSSQLSLEQMQTEAQGFFDINFPDSDAIKLSSLEISYDEGSKEWTGAAEATLNTSSFFGGTSEKSLSHTAKVRWDETIVEAVFAVDMSASMCTQNDQSARERGVIAVIPDEDCTKLNALKQGLSFIIGGDQTGETAWGGLPTVRASDGQAGYKVGIVPFNHKVKFPNLDNIPAPINSAEMTNGNASYFTLFDSDPGAAETEEFPLPTITPLVSLLTESDRARLLGSVSALNTHYDVPGWTRSNLGFMASVLMLDPDHARSYVGGTTPNPFTDERTEKIIFLLTDGANMGCCFSSHGTDDEGNPNYDNQYLYSYRLDNEHLAGVLGNPEDGLCGQAKAAGVTVYTIVYDVDDRDAGGAGATIKQVLKECSSGNDGVNFYDLQLAEGERIKDAYQEIAKSLMRLKLVY